MIELAVGEKVVIDGVKVTRALVDKYLLQNEHSNTMVSGIGDLKPEVEYQLKRLQEMMKAGPYERYLMQFSGVWPLSEACVASQNE